MPIIRPHETWLYKPPDRSRMEWNREVREMGAKSKPSIPRSAPPNVEPWVVPKNKDLEPFDEYLDDPGGGYQYVPWRERLSGLMEDDAAADAYAVADAARGAGSTTSDFRDFKESALALKRALEEDGWANMLPLISVEPHYGADKDFANNEIWTWSDGIWQKGVNAFMSLCDKYDLPEGKSHEEAKRLYRFMCSVNRDYAGGVFEMGYFSAQTWTNMRDLLDDCVYPHSDCLFNYSTGERVAYDSLSGTSPTYITQRSTDTTAPETEAAAAAAALEDTASEAGAGAAGTDTDSPVDLPEAIDDTGPIPGRAILERIRASPEYKEIADIFGNLEDGYFPESLALEEVMQRHGVGIMRRLFHGSMKEALFLYGQGHNAKTMLQKIISFGLGSVWACAIRDSSLLQPSKNRSATAAKPEWAEHLGKRFSYCAECTDENDDVKLDAGVIKPRMGGESQTFRLNYSNGDPAPPWTSFITIGGNAIPSIVGGTDQRSKHCVHVWEMKTTFVSPAEMALAKSEGRLSTGQKFDPAHLKLLGEDVVLKMQRAPMKGLAYKHAILLYLADWNEVFRIREGIDIAVAAAQKEEKLPSTAELRQLLETGDFDESTYDWDTMLPLDDYEWRLLSSLMKRNGVDLVPKTLYSVLELLDPVARKSESHYSLEGSEGVTQTPEELFKQVFEFTRSPGDLMFLAKKGSRANNHKTYSDTVSMIDAYNSSPLTAGVPLMTTKVFEQLFNKFCINPRDLTRKNGALPGQSEAQRKFAELTGEKPLVQYRCEFGVVVMGIKCRAMTLEEAIDKEKEETLARERAMEEAQEEQERQQRYEEQQRLEAEHLAKEEEDMRSGRFFEPGRFDAWLRDSSNAPTGMATKKNLLAGKIPELIKDGLLEKGASIPLVEFVDVVWTHGSRCWLPAQGWVLEAAATGTRERRRQFATAIAINYFSWFVAFFGESNSYEVNGDDPRSASISGLSLCQRSGVEMEDGSRAIDNSPTAPPAAGTRGGGSVHKRAGTAASSAPSKRATPRRLVGKAAGEASSSAGLTQAQLRRHDEQMSSASSEQMSSASSEHSD